jgi:hypothetical protein
MSSLAAQPLDASGGADLGLPVRAFNRSDEDVVWQYDRTRHVIPAKGMAYVPYMAMCLWQGDPRAIDVPGGRLHEQFRRNQHHHLSILYGVYEGSDGHRQWDDIPLVECYPIDSDIPFNTVLRDPEGANLTDTDTGHSQLRMLQDQLERQAGALRVLQAQVTQQQQIDGALEAADLDPADLERQETAHRTEAPEGQSMVGPTPSRRAPKAKKAAVTRDGE